MGSDRTKAWVAQKRARNLAAKALRTKPEFRQQRIERKVEPPKVTLSDYRKWELDDDS